MPKELSGGDVEAVRARIGGDPECQDPWAGFAGAARGLGAASKRLARLER